MNTFIHLLMLLGLFAVAMPEKPEWCKKLPRSEYQKLERVSVPDPWFEVYRIRPGVFAIYEPHQSEEIISYLILGSRKAVLFDTGMGISNMRKLAEGLTRLPISILNSHTHNDHVGDNWRFNDVYGMDTEFTRTSAKGSTADAQAEIAPSEICGELPQGFDAKSYATRPWHIAHWLHEGDKLDLGGRTLQIVAVPGHTPDSIALYDAKHGLLFTGDMFYPGTIFLYRPETNLDAYVASIKKMASLPHVELLLPAHNVPVADPAYLPKVVTAMEQVRSGKLKAEQRGDRNVYSFEGFSFLVR
ncbi:MAG: MBL fold metallo-hydrolase [Candidatus Angelobacter sp. Gp1-AA117]|nr:MAG: MBL fold metallo-hydrolase [Candidatus Angelobacter sp. Gp1-AA117]